MCKSNHPVKQFRHEIALLISEVESCLQAARSKRDREFAYQHEAFHERCRQARALAGRLNLDNRSQWSLCSGEAHRIQESLKLSLAYFRGQPEG